MLLINRHGPHLPAVVRPLDRLDAASASLLTLAIDDLHAAGTADIIVDLLACDFVDVRGIDALVAGTTRSRRIGGDVRVAYPTDHAVEQVLDLCGFSGFLRHGADPRALAVHWYKP
ncbi:MAG: STAS domain-containing protein [Actinomycetota bacterium]